MVITVQDEPSTLLELLWIREAWQLEPAGADLPPQLLDTPARMSGAERQRALIGEWQDAWPELWREGLHHAAAPRDPDVVERLKSTENGSSELARLLKEITGPSWDDRFGRDALTEGSRQWLRLLIERHMTGSPHALSAQPERVALDALIPAWRAGLTTVVQIPCRGTFTRIVGESALLVTSETRNDAARYSAALALFV
ncbi:hypothetical protein [Sinomonas atrocyanea]|uniref:hypothetical protein n=1 Tax=Sinomonas atrocyanea TaxID=37927 RepID=UPI0028579E50|nr:hypothetical protein [Sinomonas atrocyanea]MDR6620777.1 hypothetical protein [Sinomonas atrocyanea]